MNHFPLRTHLVYVILLLCVCLIGFRGLPSQPWTYDDLGHIKEAWDMQSDFLILFRSEEEPTRWVLIFYYFLTYRFFGENPAGYHAVNVLFHFFNSLLCARLFQILFRDSRLAALSGFLFAINCAPYKAVYWVTTAGLLMGTTFSLCAILFSIHYWAAGRWHSMAGAIGAYAAAVLSYETLGVVLLPIAFLWWKQKRFSRHDFILPVALIATATCWVLADKFWYQTVSGKVASNALQVGFHVPYNFSFFIGRLLINAHFTPFGWSNLPPFDVPETVFDWYVAGGVLLLVGLAVASLKHETICFSTVWISTTVLPYITGPNYFYVPRYWYLSTIGGSAILAQIILYAYARTSLEPRRRVLVLSAGLTLLSFVSFQKIKHYEGRYLLHAGIII